MTPVKPSPPVSDDLNNTPRPGLSKKAKFWIGLSLAVCIPVIVGVLLWLAYLALFPNNPRLVVNSVRLAGNSGYWSPADPDERQARMDRILSILRVQPGETPMFSGRKEYDLAAMAAKLRSEIPELERADIRRVLPDQLIFELHERIPVANLGANFYIDDSATVLDKSSYYDVSGSLPALSCKPSAVRASHEAEPFTDIVFKAFRSDHCIVAMRKHSPGDSLSDTSGTCACNDPCPFHRNSPFILQNYTLLQQAAEATP